MLLTLTAVHPALAGYKAKPWAPKGVEAYPARLSSEKITIAVEPMHNDELASQVFDSKSMVTAGIMPLAIVVFNDNEFPIEIEADPMELIVEGERLRTLVPVEVLRRVFPKAASTVVGSRGPSTKRLSRDSNPTLDDLENKFFSSKVIPAHGKGGGFLYLDVPRRPDLSGFLSGAQVYIPEIIRKDTGANMIFFEIDLKPALGTTPTGPR